MSERRFGLRAASGLSLFLAVAVFALMALLTMVFHRVFIAWFSI